MANQGQFTCMHKIFVGHHNWGGGAMVNLHPDNRELPVHAVTVQENEQCD
jgi:hypothetical protein